MAAANLAAVSPATLDGSVFHAASDDDGIGQLHHDPFGFVASCDNRSVDRAFVRFLQLLVVQSTFWYQFYYHILPTPCAYLVEHQAKICSHELDHSALFGHHLTECFSVIWDTGATRPLSAYACDFVGPIISPPAPLQLGGIASGLSVAGLGTVKRTFLSNEGRLLTLHLKAYYVPACKHCLLFPRLKRNLKKAMYRAPLSLQHSMPSS